MPQLSVESCKFVSNFPLDEILHNCDVNGRVVMWSVMLSEFNIKWV